MQDPQGWFVRASITTVPLLGFLLTVFGIINSFLGCGGEKWTCLAALVERLAMALVPSAWGILLGSVQLFLYGLTFAGSRSRESARTHPR